MLVYTEGCTADDHLLVRLEGGAVVARLSLGENGERHLQEESLGENLNDNTPHTITIYQDPALYQLRYVLDSLDPVEETYPSDLYPEFGESGVYLGGVPDSSPRSGEAPFNTSYVGCLEDVVFANGTISSEGVATSELSVVGVVGTRGMVQDGCLDPCSGMSCGEGSCVARWPDRGFCDCRNTMALGVACDEGELEIVNSNRRHDPHISGGHRQWGQLPHTYLEGTGNGATPTHISGGHRQWGNSHTHIWRAQAMGQLPHTYLEGTGNGATPTHISGGHRQWGNSHTHIWRVLRLVLVYLDMVPPPGT